jgi:hypothetical protein
VGSLLGRVGLGLDVTTHTLTAAKVREFLSFHRRHPTRKVMEFEPLPRFLVHKLAHPQPPLHEVILQNLNGVSKMKPGEMM